MTTNTTRSTNINDGRIDRKHVDNPKS